MLPTTPDTKYPHYVEIATLEKPPFDVWLQDNFKKKSKCKHCGKNIYRGITKNLKKIPISLVVDHRWDYHPVPHWDECRKRF